MTSQELRDKLRLIYKLGYTEHSQICEMEDTTKTISDSIKLINEIVEEFDLLVGDNNMLDLKLRQEWIESTRE